MTTLAATKAEAAAEAAKTVAVAALPKEEVVAPAGGTPAATVPAVTTASNNEAAVPAKGDTLITQMEAMQEVRFQQLRSEGLKVQKEATDRFGKGDTDEAIDMLKAFVAKVKATQLDPAKQSLLNRQVETRVAQLSMMKHQQDVLTGEDRAKETFRREMTQEALQDAKKKEEIAKLMKQFNQLMDDHKFREAERMALMAKELDPDNPALIAAASVSKMRNRQEVWDAIKKNKEEFNLQAGDEPHDFGPYVSPRNPVSIDPEVMRSNNANRPSYLRGLDSGRPRTEKEREIELKLNRNIDINFSGTSLRQAIDDIRTRSGINMTISGAVEEEGISLDRPVSEKLTDIPLKSAMEIILKKAQLAYVIEDNVLKVTTKKEARGRLRQITMLVADLVVPVADSNPSQTSNLSKMLEHHLSTTTGRPEGSKAASPFTSTAGMESGVGSAGQGGRLENQQKANGDMVVLASKKTGEDVLIKLITNTIKPDTWANAGGSGTIEYYPLGLALIINQTPDVIEEVARLLESLRQLQDLEVSVEVRLITLSETFFERIGIDLSFNIQTDNVDLRRVIPQPAPGPINGTNPFIIPRSPNAGIVGLTPAGSFTNDLDIPIRSTSFGYSIPPFGGFPNSIGANGGLGLGLAFLNDIQVFMFMEAAQGDRRTNIMQAPKLTMFNGQNGSITIQDNQFFVTGVNVAEVNGQVFFSPQNIPFPIGLTMNIQPVVSADRRFVRMNVVINFTQIPIASATVPLFPVTTIITPTFLGSGITGIANPVAFTQFIQQPKFSTINFQTTVAVPDGGTVLLGGLKTLSEGRNEFGPPVLSKIPYVNRFFKNVGYGREAESLMVMITPRIIINREEQEKQTGVVEASGADLR